jgi:hypothetical protein
MVNKERKKINRLFQMFPVACHSWRYLQQLTGYFQCTQSGNKKNDSRIDYIYKMHNRIDDAQYRLGVDADAQNLRKAQIQFVKSAQSNRPRMSYPKQKPRQHTAPPTGAKKSRTERNRVGEMRYPGFEPRLNILRQVKQANQF